MPSVPLTVVDAQVPATWAEARKLVEKVRAGARAWLELGAVLEDLRAEFFAQGGSGRFGSPTGSANRGKQFPTPTESASGGDEHGWQAKVREELGISDDMARYYISGRRGFLICDSVARAPEGETIDLDDGRSFPITPEARKKAEELKESILTGGTPIKRVMPAVAGLFAPGGGKGVGGKAATNHPQNMWAGVQKLRTSLRLEHWRRGTMKGGKDGWDDLVNEWDALIRQLPDELRACTAAVLAKNARK